METLYQEYSPGKPEEWPVVRLAKTGVMQRLDWWQSVIGEMHLGPAMDVEPYRIEFVLGDSDRAWLERVRKALDADREKVKREHRDPVRRLQALDDVTQEYTQLLTAVAARRVEDDDGTSRLFADTRSLGQLEKGSPDAAWLSAMISAVERSYFWAFPEIASPDDRQLICAADLQILKRISMSLNSLEYGVTREQRSDPDFLERVKVELRALESLVSPRR